MLQELNTKHLGIVSVWALVSAQALGQPTPATPPTVHWAIAVTGGAQHSSTAMLELSGAIEDGWHVYALTQPPGGPTALRVTLDANDIAQIAGPPSGTAPQKRHDPSFGLETRFYTHAFTVRLPVQLKPESAQAGQTIPVSVRFQTCSDRECQPPTTIHLAATIAARPDA